MTNKQANTSLYMPEKLKAKLRIHAAKKKVHITTCIVEAVENYLK